jgi:hypothetical protein
MQPKKGRNGISIRLIGFLCKGPNANTNSSAHQMTLNDARAITAFLRTLSGKEKGNSRRRE